MVTRELISSSATARLFLICALALIGAFVRPGMPTSEPVASPAACRALDLGATRLDEAGREGALREERARAVCAIAKPPRDGRRARAAQRAPLDTLAATPLPRPRDIVAPRTPRDRSHTARAPPPARA